MSNWTEGEPLTPTNLNAHMTSLLSSAAVYNVKDYGALGTGAGDDTTAIQSAINAAKAAGGGIVFVPAGQYPTSTISLYRNMIFRGAGGGRNLGATTPTLLLQTSSANTTFVLLGDVGGSGT